MFSSTQISNSNIVYIIFPTFIIMYLLYNMFSSKSFNIRNFATLTIWILIFIIIIIGYAFKGDIKIIKNRVLAVLLPNYQYNIANNIVIARNIDGHFYLKTYSENNNEITFLIDTGASSIALTRNDAKLFNVDLSNLIFNKKYYTANGVSYGASVIIPYMKIGEKIFYNLPATILSNPGDTSLLGMRLINKFKNFSIEQDKLILEY